MGIDPFLFAAFAAGLIAGRVLPARGAWPRRATFLVVLVLVGLLGGSLAPVPDASLLAAIPVGVAFASLLIGTTAAFAFALRPTVPTRGPGPSLPRPPMWLGLVFLGALGLGYAFGRISDLDPSSALEPTLWVLVAVVAYDLRWTMSALRRWWAPLAAALAGAVVSAVGMVVVFQMASPVALATSFGFGFYSLAGPLVDARAGATLGFVAFLANFLRENLTMVTSPWLGRYLRGEGLCALGGATSMDTTLYFVTRYGDPDAGSLAVATGLILTVAASVAIPVLLAISGA